MPVINGNKLISGKTYLMKVWDFRRGRPFKYTEKVDFVDYIFSGRRVLAGSFKMSQLHTGLGQTCHLIGRSSGKIILHVGHDPKIWVTPGDDRVTFDT